MTVLAHLSSIQIKSIHTFFQQHISKEYATQHDYQEDIPSDIFPYDYRYAACQKIENWNRNYAQAQGQPKRLHNMRPVVR